MNDAVSTFSQRDSPDHRGLEVRGHGNRPALSVDLHPGVCGGNAGALHAAAVPKLQHAHCRRVGVGFYVLMISFLLNTWRGALTWERGIYIDLHILVLQVWRFLGFIWHESRVPLKHLSGLT